MIAGIARLAPRGTPVGGLMRQSSSRLCLAPAALERAMAKNIMSDYAFRLASRGSDDRGADPLTTAEAD